MKYIEACKECKWHLRIWPKGNPENGWECVYRCKSWRHDGECSQWRASQDFSRIVEAVQTRNDWTYTVFTYPTNDWPDKAKLYKFGVVSWSRLRKRMVERFGKFAYIQTWEAHKSGYPHMNCLIGNPELWKLAKNYPHKANGKNLSLVESIVSHMAKPCGFGWKVYVDAVRSREGMSDYLVKQCEELTGAGQKDQRPLAAPPHFRRIRASRGLLPPIRHNPELTGQMLFRPIPFQEGEIENENEDADSP